MLTDIEIRKAKPTEQPKKLTDSGGLFLLITPQGSKLWRMAYRMNGKQKTLYMGAYPAISLTDAREKRDEAKKQLVNGIDPSTAKQALKATQNTKRRLTAFKSLRWNGIKPIWQAKARATLKK